MDFNELLEQDLLLARVYRLAKLAHDAQVDKAGAPYFAHPLRVAKAVHAAGYAPEFLMAALLHDVLEDTPITRVGLLHAGVPAVVVDAVVALTHDAYEPNIEYYARVRLDPVALAVKRYDILDNLDPARLALLPDPVQERLVKKYGKALRALGF